MLQRAVRGLLQAHGCLLLPGWFRPGSSQSAGGRPSCGSIVTVRGEAGSCHHPVGTCWREHSLGWDWDVVAGSGADGKGCDECPSRVSPASPQPAWASVQSSITACPCSRETGTNVCCWGRGRGPGFVWEVMDEGAARKGRAWHCCPLGPTPFKSSSHCLLAPSPSSGGTTTDTWCSEAARAVARSDGERGAGGRGGGVPWQQAEDKASVRARGRGRGQRVRVGEHWQHSLRTAAGGSWQPPGPRPEEDGSYVRAGGRAATAVPLPGVTSSSGCPCGRTDEAHRPPPRDTRCCPPRSPPGGLERAHGASPPLLHHPPRGRAGAVRPGRGVCVGGDRDRPGIPVPPPLPGAAPPGRRPLRSAICRCRLRPLPARPRPRGAFKRGEGRSRSGAEPSWAAPGPAAPPAW